MRINYTICFNVIIIVSVLLNGCSKENNSKTPNVSTSEISGISQITAISGGTITSDEGDIIIEKGVCWDSIQTPTISNNKTSDGDGSGIFTSSLIGLVPNTKYFVRAYATNSNGTGYGNTMTVTTKPFGSLMDIEGNQYKTLTLGNKEWMFENLKVTRYRNGDAVSVVTDNTVWTSQTSGAYCNYNNLGSNGEKYGRLYNLFTIKDSRNICPTGWHIPSIVEVTALKNSVGSEPLVKIGFFRNGGGNRQAHDGSFVELGTGYFWTSNTSGTDGNWGFSAALNTDFSGLNTHGFSIRCIKD